MIGDKLLYNGWLKLYERTVKGRKYCVIDGHDAVGCIVINGNNEILLVKQYRPSILKETLEIPAGCMDVEGESPKNTIVRELKEETKLIISADKLKKVIKYNSNVGFCNNIMILYYTKIENPIFTKEDMHEEDVSSVIWMPLKTFEEKISNEEITDNKTIVSYLLLKNMLL